MLLPTLLAVSPLLALLQASPITIQPRDGCSSNPKAYSVPKGCDCSGTNTNQTLLHTYVCGDTRLGPIRLPTRLSLDDLVNTYNRFGGLCPGAFLTRWYDPIAKSFIYPPQSGFQLDTSSAPIEGNVLLPVGATIDRFGSEYGSFASPAGAPYMQRALPPSNLDAPPNDPRFPINYHAYQVLQPLTVLAGPIAGWFGQPGQGVQYQLSSNIMTLLSGGFIARVSLADL